MDRKVFDEVESASVLFKSLSKVQIYSLLTQITPDQMFKVSIPAPTLRKWQDVVGNTKLKDAKENRSMDDHVIPFSDI